MRIITYRIRKWSQNWNRKRLRFHWSRSKYKRLGECNRLHLYSAGKVCCYLIHLRHYMLQWPWNRSEESEQITSSQPPFSVSSLRFFVLKRHKADFWVSILVSYRCWDWTGTHKFDFGMCFDHGSGIINTVKDNCRSIRPLEMVNSLVKSKQKETGFFHGYVKDEYHETNFWQKYESYNVLKCLNPGALQEGCIQWVSQGFPAVRGSGGIAPYTLPAARGWINRVSLTSTNNWPITELSSLSFDMTVNVLRRAYRPHIKPREKFNKKHAILCVQKAPEVSFQCSLNRFFALGEGDTANSRSKPVPKFVFNSLLLWFFLSLATSCVITVFGMSTIPSFTSTYRELHCVVIYRNQPELQQFFFLRWIWRTNITLFCLGLEHQSLGCRRGSRTLIRGAVDFWPQGGGGPWAQNLLKMGGFPEQLPEKCMILKKTLGARGAGVPWNISPQGPAGSASGAR